MEISTLAIIGTLVTIYIRLAIVGRDNKRLRAEMLHGFGALDKKIDTLRTEMNNGDQALRDELSKEIKTGDQALRTDMNTGNQALANKIDQLRTDMNNGDQALAGKIDTVDKSLSGKIDQLRTDMIAGDQALAGKIETTSQALRDELSREMNRGFDIVYQRLDRIEDSVLDLTRSLGQVEGRSEMLSTASHSPANPH
ncbi:MAG: hypothetical protein OXH95_05740 [bacterium]|nr:hypothetical protein [bacterium]